MAALLFGSVLSSLGESFSCNGLSD